MNTITNSDLAEAKLTGYYLDRTIQFIVTSEGLEDNMPGDFSEMMIFLYNARDIFYMYANGTEGKDTRKLIDALNQNPIPEEINDAKEFALFIDNAIQYIVTSEELKLNFPGDFDLMMLYLFKARSFFDKVAEVKNDKAVLAMVADQPGDAAPDEDYKVDMPVFNLYVAKSLNITIPVNVLVLNNWPEDLAKTELLNFLQQLQGYDRQYFGGSDLLELYSVDKIGGDVIAIESAGIELIEKLLSDIKKNQILALTTNLEDSVLRELLTGKTEGKAVLYQPHNIKVTFQY